MMKIDLVIPYVDGSDPRWNEIYYKNNNVIKDYAWTKKEVRFDENSFVKYVFRSIDLYAPWINKIHLLVMMDSQVPVWVNREKVHVVYHKDFIPEEYLPCFSSSLIEMFLWNIPELSERFIYINDDLFFNSHVSPEEYFDLNDKNKIVYNNVQHVNYKNLNRINETHISMFINSVKLAADGLNIEYICYQTLVGPLHLMTPFVKSRVKEAFDAHEKEIMSSLSMFREEKNLNQYYFSLYDAFRGYMKPEHRNGRYRICKIRDAQTIKKDLYNPAIKEICINDIETTTYDDKMVITELLKAKFPNKSKYEK